MIKGAHYVLWAKFLACTRTATCKVTFLWRNKYGLILTHFENFEA
jgi:hypothetical protein